MRLEDERGGLLPLESIRSSFRFILLDLDFRLLSEHTDGKSASQALKRFLLEDPEEEAAIYQRTPRGWVKF